MKKGIFIFFCLIFIKSIICQTSNNQSIMNTVKSIEEIVYEKETASLNRWIRGDVWGFINLFSEDGTYFDQGTKQRVDGKKAIENYLSPFNGKIYSFKYEILNKKIIVEENIAILTYNLKNINEKNEVTHNWCSTEIYKFEDNDWKLQHSHWSIIN